MSDVYTTGRYIYIGALIIINPNIWEIFTLLYSKFPFLKWAGGGAADSATEETREVAI